MFKIIWVFTSILAIILILLKVPNNTGLESIASKNNFLGSPSSTEKFITYATVLYDMLYWICHSI